MEKRTYLIRRNVLALLKLECEGLAGYGFHENLHASSKTKQMESRLLLDVVVSQGPPVLQLLASKNQALLIGRDTLLVQTFLHVTCRG